MRHIKAPVTLPPDKAEKLYIAAGAVQELAELVDTGKAAATENLLRILSEQFSEGLSDVSFPFED